jgi:PAS domain S-box-containing protein
MGENVSAPLDVEYGFAFWFMIIYNYCILFVSGYLFFKILKHSKIYLFRVSTLYVCLLVPWISHVSHVLGFSPIRFDITSLLVNIAGIAIAWISPERLYQKDIIPAARKTIIESISDAVLILDPQDYILNINRVASRMSGHDISKAIGEKISVLWPQLSNHLMDAKNGDEIELFIDDSKRIFIVNLSNLEEWQSDVRCRTIVLKDITDLRAYSEHLEELIEERTSELRHAERMATIGETSAMIGHDLRNPLQVIFGMVSLVKKGLKKEAFSDVDPSERRTIEQRIEKIEVQANYMNKIVSDLQDYARPIKPIFEEISLDILVSRVISTLKVPRNIDISIMFDKEFPHLFVDTFLIMRVFTNLILNSIQAMPGGGQMKIKGLNSDEYAYIKIEDTGEGISKKNMENVFKPLFTTKAKGTGLGLNVCKRIVEAHNGEITIESELGVGSTITLKLPLERPLAQNGELPVEYESKDVIKTV